MPAAFKELTRIYGALEKHYRDMQDMEFTVEQGKLWMLQTRNGKRTAKAALRIAVELANEKLITKDEAVARIEPGSLDQLLHPTIDPKAERNVIATGLPASPGAASGEIVFNSDEATKLKADGKKVILVRVETSPEDIHGMHAAEGILTTRGGMTSHAAVVARGMGKPCVSGAGTLRVDYNAQTLQAGNVVLKRGEIVTIDGSTGQVLAGGVPMTEPAMSGEFGTLMGWADKVRKLGVRANADTPADARVAVRFGAEGIGLCRTEHMFFDEARIQAVREMILADDEKSRRKAIDKLLPMQRGDFVELFEIMKGLPVTIRLLDPPLHEFLPHGEEDIAEVAAAMGVDPKKIEHRAKELAEFNPMLGFRGCRIAIAYPEIAEMQARAIFEAAVEAGKRTGKPVVPEVMVPLIATKAEFDIVKARIDAMAQAVMKETGVKLNYQVGTMIELPRAALMADEIAQSAEFFSFGTNDLTQTTFGISRDDAASLPRHLRCARHPAGRSVRVDRPRRRRRAGSDRRRARPQGAARSSRSASAASTAATRRRSRSATRSGSTTCPARRSACRSRGWPRRRPPSARRRRARRNARLVPRENRRHRPYVRRVFRRPDPVLAWLGETPKRQKRRAGGTMADGNIPALAGDPPGISEAALKKGRGVHRGRRGRVQPAVRHRGQCRHHRRGGDVAVPPLRRHRRRLAVPRFPDHRDAAAALRARRLRAGAELPAVSDGDAVPQPHPLVGRGAGIDRRRHPDLRHRGRRGFHRPRHLADPARHRARRHLHRAAAGGDAAHHRLDRAGHRARRSSPTPISGRICRSRGRTAASTSASSSAICSSRWKASSAFRSTCRRR